MERIVQQLQDQIAQYQGQLAQLTEQTKSVEDGLKATQGGLNLLRNLQSGGYELVLVKSEDGTTGEHDVVTQGQGE